jgi:hypothetical protein
MRRYSLESGQVGNARGLPGVKAKSCFQAATWKFMKLFSLLWSMCEFCFNEIKKNKRNEDRRHV